VQPAVNKTLLLLRSCDYYYHYCYYYYNQFTLGELLWPTPVRK